MEEQKYTVYAIQSEKDGRIYVGFTKDLERRVLWHNQGKTKSTKGYRPWKILYFEKVDDRHAARKRELYLKSGCGKEFLKDLAP